MELSSHEAEIPMPINSYYGGVPSHGHAHQGHMTHQHHHHYHQQNPSSSSTSHNNHNIMPSSTSTQIPSSKSHSNASNGTNNDRIAPHLEGQKQEVPYKNGSNKDHSKPNSNHTELTTTKKLTRYRECQKNHAASMGGNATDGCGEFMPSGEEGSLEALICSVCNCHRNFHRKEIEADHHQHQQQYPLPNSQHFYLPTPHNNPHHQLGTRGRKVILGSGGNSSGGGGFLGYPTRVGGMAVIPVSSSVPMNVGCQVGPTNIPSDQSDEYDHHHHQHGHRDHYGDDGDVGGMMMGGPNNYQMVKKRFRTKFSQEQKQKMLEFAEKVGWKIQKQEDAVVQNLCQELGIKRKVLKVWMHNNKHSSSKKNNLNTDDPSLLS